MDLRKLKTLIDLVSESNISELEITEAEGKVRIVKASGVPLGGAPLMYAPGQPAPAAAPQTVAQATAALAAATAAEGQAEPAGRVIKSPMVGTFYLSASPGAKPFVELGDSIKLGQPVCIIEAMKIMNEIESDCEGKVVRLLCENGEAVEFGQPLFVVE